MVFHVDYQTMYIYTHTHIYNHIPGGLQKTIKWDIMKDERSQPSVLSPTKRQDTEGREV